MENTKHNDHAQQEQDNFLGESQLAGSSSMGSADQPVQRKSMAPPPFGLEASPVQMKGAGPIQRNSDDVQDVVDEKLLEKPTNQGYQFLNNNVSKKTVNWFISHHNKHNTNEEKIEIAEAWNTNLKNHKVRVPKSTVKKSKPVNWDKVNLNNFNKNNNEMAQKPPGLARRDSAFLTRENWSDFLAKVSPGEEMDLYTPSSEEWSRLPVLESASNAARLVRLFWINNQDNKNKKLKGPLFGFKRGAMYGVFEARGSKDVIFTLLRKDKQNDWERDGQTFDWSTMAGKLNNIPRNWAIVKREILDVLLNRGIPKNVEILETVGAMICDAKWSMTGFLDYLEKFENSLEVNPKKLFSSNSKDNPVWEPSTENGRKKVLYNKSNLLKSEENDNFFYDGVSKSNLDKDKSVPPPINKNDMESKEMDFNYKNNNNNNKNIKPNWNLNDFKFIDNSMNENNNNKNINFNNNNTKNNNNESSSLSFTKMESNFVSPNTILPELNDEIDNDINMDNNEVEMDNNENETINESNNNENLDQMNMD